MNRIGEVDKFLEQIEYPSKINKPKYNAKKTSKILIVGESEINENVIRAIFKDVGISRDRIETVLGYEKANKYDFINIQWNDKYGAILLGPIAHCTTSKANASSTISEIENCEGYPPIRRLISNKVLKITKSNLKTTLNLLIEEGIVFQNM